MNMGYESDDELRQRVSDEIGHLLPSTVGKPSVPKAGETELRKALLKDIKIQLEEDGWIDSIRAGIAVRIHKQNQNYRVASTASIVALPGSRLNANPT